MQPAEEMTKNNWYRIDVTTTSCAVDLITQFLIAVGCKGSVSQANDNLAVVSGYVPCDGRRAEWERVMAQRIDIAKSYGLIGNETQVNIQEVVGEDWAESWKTHFRPIDIGRVLRVIPPWIEQESQDRKTIRIDPGMAFGTGQHATTVLCLELMETLIGRGDTVIDVGTGSGILAIAAASLGARRVIAIDSDPVCPPSAFRNCRANGVENSVFIVNGDLLSCMQIRADLITANLTSYGIMLIAESITRYLRAGGGLIASGIPTERAAEVSLAIQSGGMRIERVREREGWVGIAARFCPECDHSVG